MEPKSRPNAEPHGVPEAARSLVGLTGEVDTGSLSEELRQRRRRIAVEAVEIEEQIESGDLDRALKGLEALEARYGAEAPVDLIEEKLSQIAKDNEAARELLDRHQQERPARADRRGRCRGR